MKNCSKDKMLSFFGIGREMPILKTEKERSILLQLWKYNLIEENPEGKFVITKRGNDALSFGVENFLTLERYEKRGIRDGFRTKTAEKWLFLILVPLIMLEMILAAIQLL